MSVESLEILEPGLLTTVQDLGRYGYQRYGVPVSGAMDGFALRAANLLVGDDVGAAGLEMTVLGPKIRFLTETWIAVTGADLTANLDGEPLPRWQTLPVSKGSVLSFHGARDGVRSYLAVAGGLDVPEVMGSRSTYLPGAFGGLEGRALKAGDALLTSALAPGAEMVERRLPRGAKQPAYGREHDIRVVLGPQDGAFTPGGVSTFLNSSYSVSIHSDRMGYQLEGPAVEHLSGADIVSDGTPLGAVQVPGDGRPIILLADRGTTGGYAKIATVIAADMSEMAQTMPGDTLAFRAISIDEARALLRKQETLLDAIRRDPAEGEIAGRVTILVEGETFEVVDDDGEALSHPGRIEWPASVQSRRLKATLGGRSYEFDVEVEQGES